MTFIVERAVREPVEAYMQPFEFNTTFHTVSIEDFLEQVWLVDGMKKFCSS